MVLTGLPLRSWPVAPLAALLTLCAAGAVIATSDAGVIDAEPLSFTAPIRGSGGTCSMSLRPLPSNRPSDDDSVRIVWSCTLDLPPDINRTVGYSAVGGLLEFQVLAQDSVLAVGRARTGGMRWGQAYSFSDTLALPSPVDIGQLAPRWQLTCHGIPMKAISLRS